ncbi:MAG: hypothetical protein ABEK50_11600 [bacterium]
MARAEAVAIFEEHRAVSLKNARKAVNKAGFKFLGAEVVARGKLAWADNPGKSDLLLKDPKARMTLRLTASDTESVYQNLAETYKQDNFGDTVQVHGTVLESKPAKKRAKKLGAQFSLAVTDWSPGKSAKLPSLVPKEPKEKEDQKQADDGWF